MSRRSLPGKRRGLLTSQEAMTSRRQRGLARRPVPHGNRLGPEKPRDPRRAYLLQRLLPQEAAPGLATIGPTRLSGTDFAATADSMSNSFPIRPSATPIERVTAPRGFSPHRPSIRAAPGWMFAAGPGSPRRGVNRAPGRRKQRRYSAAASSGDAASRGRGSVLHQASSAGRTPGSVPRSVFSGKSYDWLQEEPVVGRLVRTPGSTCSNVARVGAMSSVIQRSTTPG